MPFDGWDHVELWVGNAKQAAFFYEHAFGFTRTAYAGPETGVRDRASYVLEQGDIRLVVTSGLRADSEITQYACRHGDGGEGHRACRCRAPPRPTARPSSAARAGSPSRTGSRTTSAASSCRRSAPTATSIHTFVNRRDYAGPYLPGYVVDGRERPRRAAASA